MKIINAITIKNALRRVRALGIDLCFFLITHLLPDGYRQYRFVGGKIYLNLKESHTMLARRFSLYEKSKVLFIRRFLKPGMTFIDIGSHTGYFSLIAARTLRQRGLVFAFEPEPKNCNLIRRNIDLNSYTNIMLWEGMLGAEDEEASLHLSNESGHHSILPNLPYCRSGTITVPQWRLDLILNNLNPAPPSIDLIKIDVEGDELAVLKGAQQTLSQNHSLILLLDLHPHLGVSSIDVCKFLEYFGFEIRSVSHPYQRLPINESLIEILAIPRCLNFR